MLFAPKRSRPAEPVELPRDEMAFRRQYQRLLLQRRITTVFRPGDRLYPAWRGYAPGETITVRVISRHGSDALGIAPVFNRVRLPVRILDVVVAPVDALGPDDFVGSSPDVTDAPSLLQHLAAIYEKPISAFGGIVTRIRFEYLNGRA
jgi:hypothetical protein